jgi:hypothetical protein
MKVGVLLLKGKFIYSKFKYCKFLISKILIKTRKLSVNRPKKKVDFRFFIFFLIFMKAQVKKKLINSGKKIKCLILIDRNPEKTFLDLFL